MPYTCPTIMIAAMVLASCASLDVPTAQTKDPKIAGWFFNFDNDRCVIWRSEKNKAFLYFENDWHEEPKLVIQVAEVSKKPDAGAQVEIGPFSFPAAEGRQYDGIAGFGAPMPAGFERWLASRQSVVMKLGEQKPASVSFDGFSEAFAAYDACLSERATKSESARVFKTPEFDGFEDSPMVRALLADLSRKGLDYVRFRTAVDRAGNPSSCEIRESSGNKDMDRKICQAIETHGRFKMATTIEGEPVRSHYQGIIPFE